MVGMAKKRMQQFEGASNLRDRLVLSLLSGVPVRVSAIRAESTKPGLCGAEVSFIRLLDKVTSGSGIHINNTGTVLVFRPGHLSGAGRGMVTHNCESSRAVSYYARPLLTLAPFFKTPLRIVLRGATHIGDNSDGSADSLANVCAPLLRRLTLGQSLSPSITVNRRAFEEGEVVIVCGVLAGKLKAVDLISGGVVKRIRGIAYASRTSPSALARMVDAARGVLNRFSPDVYIHTDHGRSGSVPGYAMHLMAETTEGCLLSADWGSTDSTVTPESVARSASNLLLEEIAGGGCVDADHAPFALMYCALADSEISRLRVGRLSNACVTLLRDLQLFLGVVFKVRVEQGARGYSDSEIESSEESEEDNEDEEDEENIEIDGAEAKQVKKLKGVKERGIVMSCVGIGQSNIARQRF